MPVLPPGTLLQLMYLDERLENIPAGRFIEIGPGSGEITQKLLNAGWMGDVYDLSEETLNKIRIRFATEFAEGRLHAFAGDFLELSVGRDPGSGVDLIISCMVMEHMLDASETNFMEQAAKLLDRNGMMIGLVPASMAHWGIEDEVAGHVRRYDRATLLRLFEKTGWTARHLAGLTYPVSNILLPLSNFLVRKSEGEKTSLSQRERTKYSGRREVRFKTTFPSVLGLVLNEVTMLPLHWLQKAFSGSTRSLVIYFEAVPVRAR
jgi:phospholipid N-methyltransferase